MFSSGVLLVGRGVKKLAKSPGPPLTGLASSLFFLLVYQAGIGGIGHLPAFGAAGYFPFLFPLGVVSLAMGSAAGAGQTLHADLTSGYFRRLFLSPAPRWAFALAPVFADTAATLLATVGLIAVGLVWNVPLRFGVGSFGGIVLLSTLWGLTLSGFSGGIMLRTGKPDGARVVTSAVFPLLFLSTTFLPRELITSRWLLVVSRFNPVTYLLEAQRYLLGGTADKEAFLIGLGLVSLSAVGGLLFVLRSARKIIV